MPENELKGKIAERLADPAAPGLGPIAVDAAGGALKIRGTVVEPVRLPEDSGSATGISGRYAERLGLVPGSRHDDGALGPDRIERFTGKLVADLASRPEAGAVSRAETFPTFGAALRPEKKKVKVLSPPGAELRQSSIEGQDGLAYNSGTNTVVLTDGMGGVGDPGDVKNNFGFALAHAAAELDDILTLRDPEIVKAVIGRTKAILSAMGMPVGPVPGVPVNLAAKVSSRAGAGRDLLWGAALAAAQRVPGSANKWRIVTYGDCSVAILNEDGRIERGYGEAFDSIRAGRLGASGGAEEGLLRSYLGIGHDFKGFANLGGAPGLESAMFKELTLARGQRLVLTSDAYAQKTALPTLEGDAALTTEQWARKKPTYDDDTTMAIVG